MGMGHIHPTAVVDDGAEVSEDAFIGPFCVIGPEVKIGASTRLESHVSVSGQTTIGDGCQIFPFSSLGHVPQDLKYAGETVSLEIGDKTVIREHVTMNPGTAGGSGITRVGSGCLIMVGAHIAHDCIVGNHVILVNNATLAGHVEIGDHAIIGGLSALHQFVRVGPHAMIGGMSGVENDIIPYGSALGNRAYLGGLNLVGLKRRGFDRDAIHSLRRAYRMLFAEEGNLTERVDDVIRSFPDDDLVGEVVEFIQAQSDRGLCVPRS